MGEKEEEEKKKKREGEKKNKKERERRTNEAFHYQSPWDIVVSIIHCREIPTQLIVGSLHLAASCL